MGACVTLSGSEGGLDAIPIDMDNTRQVVEQTSPLLRSLNGDMVDASFRERNSVRLLARKSGRIVEILQLILEPTRLSKGPSPLLGLGFDQDQLVETRRTYSCMPAGQWGRPLRLTLP